MGQQSPAGPSPWRFQPERRLYLISVPRSVQRDELRAVPGVIGDHREANLAPVPEGWNVTPNVQLAPGPKVAGHVLETMWDSVVNELMELIVIARFPTFSRVMV